MLHGFRAVCAALVAAWGIALLAGCSHAKTIAEGGPARIGMVTDTGGLGDRSFNDSAYAGLVAAQKALHADISVLQSKSASDYQPNLTVLANKEYDLIFAIGFLMAKDLNETAARFPQRRFAIIDAVVDQPNVASVTFKEEDGSFLAGAAAAMVSKTHQIAFLGGIDIPLLRKFEAGFTAGAREIDPNIKVAVKYVGSFDDAAAGKELSGVLFDQGADIVFVAAGKAGIGAIDQVKTRPNDYIIGVDSDQDALAPGKVLTSMIKRVDVGVFRLAQETVAQKLPSGQLVLGLKENGVGLSSFAYTKNVMTPERIARIKRIRAAIIAGTIKPPATREELAQFKPVPLGR
ncbi:MAG: BMP family ABC transporter substrate-binding protein [Candidatus Velthaea sp.]|jgi:basic membrane protein A